MLFGSLTSIDNWGVKDPFPGAPIASVLPMSKRAHCQLARNASHPILKTNFIHIVGAIQMMEGMDYHASNFARITTQPYDTLEIPSEVDHEAVAYLNRMGQFLAFADSDFVRAAVRDVQNRLPTIRRLIVFRHKIAAHRSIDAPHNETPGEQVRHAAAITPMTGRLYVPRPGVARPNVEVSHRIAGIAAYMNAYRPSAFLAYQIWDSKAGDALNFVLEQDHEEVGIECFDLIAELLS